jgi:D-xylose transport system permease protein
MDQTRIADREMDLTPHAGPASLRSGFGNIFVRLNLGDLPALPIIVGLVLIWGIMQGLNSSFLSSRNLVNLATQIASDGIIAVGIVLVLLVAEIDLSVGSMSGVASSLLGIGLVREGWPLPLTMGVALAGGLVVGALYGAICVRFGVPSFVVTLAGLLALLGFQLQILGVRGSINIPFNSAIVGFMQRAFVPHIAAYALGAVTAALFLLDRIVRAIRRRRAGLPDTSIGIALIQALALLALIEIGVWHLNKARGVSLPFVLLLVIVVITNLALKRTRWGRYVYAIGGSVEAARRAGIRVNRVYISAFALCSFLAALGGLMSAGRLAAASIASGTGDTNLNAIAAAVIGGTSLFGGRGNAYSALLGIIVIESIANGLTLLNLTSAVRYMITGGVLVIAVIVDSMTRRARAMRGAV